MKKTPISDRLRYAFDNVMSRGIIGLIAWLALISVSVVLVTSVVVWLTKISTERSLAEQFWAYLAQTVKATPMTDRPWPHRLPQLVITYTGLFVTGALIGILTSAQISINPHRSNTGQSRHRPPRPFSQHPPQVLATGLSGLISSMRLSTRSCKVGRNLREARDVKIDIRSEAASYYDLSPQHPKDIPFYEDRIPSPDASILELGCGTGRVLVPLAASCGYIHGLDLSEAMIAVCLRRLREAGTEPGKACAEVGDITDFSLGWRFDLITAPFRVLQNIETE
ncbi:MAG: class I SAM-dependent methyltransferase [Anaerolineae bacterium]|nr:class I SAM-dependent methyltransferase [Anaerolineae bacterium]